MSKKCLVAAAIGSFVLAAMIAFAVSLTFGVIIPVHAVNGVAIAFFVILGYSMYKEAKQEETMV